MSPGMRVFALFGLVACNVQPPPSSTGGAVFGDAGDAGAACESAVVIVDSDYSSTNISIAALDGTMVSGSFVSSGATRPGLALALSGDVDIPFVAPASGRVVLIDRYGTNVLTWMNVSDATVVAQLPVGTGFQSNPHDYLEVGAARAIVSRFGTNPTPGAQAFDQGGDLLVLDTSSPGAPTIEGRIAIPEENPALQPCPDLMTWLGDEVVLTLGRWSADFSQVGDGRFVGVSPQKAMIDWTVNVSGLRSCGRLASSPSGKVAAVACSGQENMETNTFTPAMSDIVVYDATATPPREVRRLGLGARLDAALQPTIAFAGEDVLVAMTYGGNATAGDTAFSVDVTSGDVTTLGEASKPFVLGGLHCAPGCGDICILSDAERSDLRRWRVTNGAFTALADTAVDPSVGLPPRDIGGLR